MTDDPPGWYWDPRRPGIKRYWDGHAWVDVDSPATDRPAAPSPTTASRPDPGSPLPAADDVAVIERKIDQVLSGAGEDVAEPAPRLIRQRRGPDPAAEM